MSWISSWKAYRQPVRAIITTIRPRGEAKPEVNFPDDLLKGHGCKFNKAGFRNREIWLRNEEKQKKRRGREGRGGGGKKEREEEKKKKKKKKKEGKREKEKRKGRVRHLEAWHGRNTKGATR